MNISKKLKEHFAPKENAFSQGGTVIGMYKHKDYEDIVYVGDDMHTLCILSSQATVIYGFICVPTAPKHKKL